MDLDKNKIKDLAKRVIHSKGFKVEEIERYCWMTVHEYHHGTPPVEYDIREIDEGLFLSVLEESRKIIKYN